MLGFRRWPPQTSLAAEKASRGAGNPRSDAVEISNHRYSGQVLGGEGAKCVVCTTISGLIRVRRG